MQKFSVTRGLNLPDPVRISRYKRLPELGPTLLFFSGGSALNPTARALKQYTHNSIHFMTPFDSGGSSAVLRHAFGMPAIGDLRSRLIALADESVLGQSEIYRLFTHRFPKEASQDVLLGELVDLLEGHDHLISRVPNPMRRLICNQLGFFHDAMPSNFDLRGASIGNLILAGGYLNNNQKLDPIIFLFSKLVNTLGTVLATVDARLHLAVELDSGEVIVGQHGMSGKESAPIASRINRTYLTRSLAGGDPVEIEVSPKKQHLIETSDMICYPPGSFHSSLVANLLPKGVGKAIARSANPKVYIPNLGRDPEQFGMSPNETIDALLKHLRADAGQDTPTDKLLNFVITDEKYAAEFDWAALEAQGISLIGADLTSAQSNPYYDPEKLVCMLLSFL
ncbi:Gluconeogenesis factor [Pseudovibrio axinellae]|uniref:Gluconeogenesis factor n=1 Tax=Pseudovibrio axinellae TaxID=989403 RepID=A0A165U1E2_9HYPH|nr:GAK system CofD-like protein [Pseudovibrio axinellae]KZL09429.1 Gluconeogenesis factor [Pseudovibrio axinellae]SEQ65162.1 CofD-related protein, GAK system [Pseudovibrio axinellae]